MCTRNVHTSNPRSFCGWLLLLSCYIPSLIAVLLISANTLPYHLVFLPHLKKACAEGWVSWFYYVYCLSVMVFSEIMVFGNFSLTIFTAPGFVSHAIWSGTPKYLGKQYSEQNPFEVSQVDRYGKLRYCARCEQFKPDNAHHCHCCNRCVYRMDHHCPWINNCVGRDNAKFFLLFLAYIPVGAFHIVITTVYSCLYHLRDLKLSFDVIDSPFPIAVYGISVILSTTMGLAFLCFAVHFLSMMYRGHTSVSKFIASKAAANAAAVPPSAATAAADRAAERDAHLYDYFGCDRRWWKLALPFRPQRDERGLLGETLPNTLSSFGKLV